jgi:hypothetical protein
MARYYDEDDYPRRRRQGGFNVYLFMIALLCTIILLGIGLLHFRPELFVSNTAPGEYRNNVGEQTTHTPRTDPVATSAPAVDTAINAYNATSQAQYDAAVLTTSNQTVATATPDLGPLPLNSAGAPIIDQVQQQQLNFSAEMAAQEALDSVANARATDVASRPPDVSKADAEAMMHRDLCHVPRADPHTCEQGLYKPTPVQ